MLAVAGTQSLVSSHAAACRLRTALARPKRGKVFGLGNMLGGIAIANPQLPIPNSCAESALGLRSIRDIRARRKLRRQIALLAIGADDRQLHSIARLGL